MVLLQYYNLNVRRGKRPAKIRLTGENLDHDEEKTEEFYAAHVGRAMWRIAKRRAMEMQQSASTNNNGPVTSQPIAFENTIASPAPRLDPTKTVAGDQNTLAKFLQALAAELAGDDQDPGGS